MLFQINRSKRPFWTKCSLAILGVECLHFLMGTLGCWLQPEFVLGSYAMSNRSDRGSPSSHFLSLSDIPLFNWKVMNPDIEAVQVFTAFYTLMLVQLYFKVSHLCRHLVKNSHRVNSHNSYLLVRDNHMQFFVFYLILLFFDFRTYTYLYGAHRDLGHGNLSSQQTLGHGLGSGLGPGESDLFTVFSPARIQIIFTHLAFCITHLVPLIGSRYFQKDELKFE